MGARGGRRRLRGATAGPARPGGSARSLPHRAAGFHVSGAQGLAVRSIPGPAGVRGAMGGRARESRERGNGKRETRARELALSRVPGAGARADRVRVLSARRPAATFPVSRFPAHVVLVVPTLHAPRAPERRPRLVAGQRPARVPGARGVTDRRPVREPRVWPARRRARASGPPASHAARGRRALARGPRHRELRGARLVLVSLHAGAQRPPARPGIATAGRRGVRGLGRAGRVGVGARPLRRGHPHRHRGPRLRARHRGARQPQRSCARTALAFRRDGGRGRG